jgi:hypothetical protein
VKKRVKGVRDVKRRSGEVGVGNGNGGECFLGIEREMKG